MKVLYLQQYFKTPNEAGSTRSYWISKELLSNGIDVVVVCQANPLAGNPQKSLINRRKIDGIDVISIRNSYSNDMGVSRRIVSFVRFMLLSLFYVLKEDKIDIIFASSTPLTIAFPALLRKAIRKTRFVFEVRDLWPEAPIQLGAIKNRILIKFLRWFEQLTYKHSEHIIALSPGMQEGIIRYVSSEKVSMIPNMAKVDKFWDRPRNNELNEKFGLDRDTFKIIYFGTLGVANGIDFLVESIEVLNEKGNLGIEFIFVGEGVKRKDLYKTKDRIRNVKVTILERQGMNIVSELVNSSDVSVCTFSDIPILKTNSPNKLFDSLSAGRPTIVNSDGWTKEIVETFACGFYVNPNSPAEFVDRILFLKSNPSVRERMGRNARNAAETYYDKSILCGQVVHVLKETIAKTK